MSLTEKFKDILSHLNAEENKKALAFLVDLREAEVECDKLACLEAGGVDNWDFYHDSLRDNNWIGLNDEEEDEE